MSGVSCGVEVGMGEITLRIEEDVLDRLRAQAVSNGRSVEDEVLRMIAERVAPESVEERERRELRETVLAEIEEQRRRPRPSREEVLREMARIRSMSLPIKGMDLTALIREDRDR